MAKKQYYAGATLKCSNRKWVNQEERGRAAWYSRAGRSGWRSRGAPWIVTHKVNSLCSYSPARSAREADLLAKAFAAGAFEPEDALRYLNCDDIATQRLAKTTMEVG